ncbi:MAG TPA: LETM1-related biofilm-associated protein [Taishania sp.]|nr:LETM1-related biofilm-associated protein [Taishania sp.]
MLNPSSSGWINKYFSLIEEGGVILKYPKMNEFDSQHQLHLLSGRTGIVFGHASRFLFYKGEDSARWTEEEKLKLLLFESLLLVYIQKYGQHEDLRNQFLDKLINYYSEHNSKSIQQMLTFWVKKSRAQQLESIFSKRIDVSKGIFDNRFWFKSLNNVFVYLDVILFDRFLNHEDTEALSSYSEYAYNSLIAILLGALSDGSIDEKEKTMFQVFLSSANLEGFYKDEANFHLINGASIKDFTDLPQKDKLFCRFIVDLALLTVFSNNEVQDLELKFIQELATDLGLHDYDVEESMAIIENFLLYSDVSNSYLSNKSSYERIYNSFSDRWTKVILRNKDKLALELTQSKELVHLIKKSATQELTAEEKEKVKTQFLDIVKSMPALAIFMLPGGAILLPLILKVLPTLIPSAFRDNE